MLIDTHCHLNFSAFKKDFAEVIDRMKKLSMQAIVVGSQNTTSKRAVDLANEHDHLYAAVGLHPVHLFSMRIEEEGMPFTTRKEQFDEEYYERLSLHPRVVAIGECGLDYHTFPANTSLEMCKKTEWGVFEKHIQLARKRSLPLIIHCRPNPENHRDAYEDLLALLKNQHPTHGVIHAFATYPDLAKKFLEQGFMLSFTGLITYPELPILRDIVRLVPLDRMMIETDAPYMAPTPHKGLRNEPSWLPLIAVCIANEKKISVQEVIETTGKNAIRFFNLAALSKTVTV